MKEKLITYNKQNAHLYMYEIVKEETQSKF